MSVINNKSPTSGKTADSRRCGASCGCRWLPPIKGVFSPNPAFFYERTQLAPRPIRAHTCSTITWRLCGWLGASGTQDLRALRLWQSSRQWRTQPWSCMDAAPGCRLQRHSSVSTLTAWPGRVAQAPRAGRARAPWSCTPCWRPSSRTARLEDQLGLDDEANSQIADGEVTRAAELPVSLLARHGLYLIGLAFAVVSSNKL